MDKLHILIENFNDMKKVLFFVAAALAAIACSEKEPAEVYIPKRDVEFAGNAFSAFSLGADVKLFMDQNPEDKTKWQIEALVPVRKETELLVKTLDMDLSPMDERGVRVRDGFTLFAEDLPNLIPVFNAGPAVEKTIVFSVGKDGKKDFSFKEATQLLNNVKNVRMNINMEAQEPEPEPKPVAVTQKKAEEKAKPEAPKPLTLDSLCKQYGVYGLLAKYEQLLSQKDKKGAKRVEDQLWEIEKKVKKDNSIPKWLRDSFQDYIEDKEDEIEKKY